MHTAGVAVRRVAGRQGRALPATIEALLRDCDRLLAQYAPRWLGHCKVLAETAHGAAYASLTGAGEPISWSGTLPQHIDQAMITVYGAVYGASDEVVAAALDAAMASHLPDAVAAPREAPDTLIAPEAL